MNISAITNVNAYVSMLSKQNQVLSRMSGGAKTSLFNMKPEKDSYISNFMKQNKDKQKTARLDGIVAKLKQGRKLSHDDMEYLRINAPDMYEKALKLKKEIEAYRKALESCKTKDEARMVHVQKMSQFAAEMKNARASKDSDTLAWIDVRAAAVLSEFVDFVKSDRFAEIPNEYEIVIENIEKSESEDEYLSQDYETENEDSSDADKKTENVEHKFEPTKIVRGEGRKRIETVSFESNYTPKISTNVYQKDVSA